MFLCIFLTVSIENPTVYLLSVTTQTKLLGLHSSSLLPMAISFFHSIQNSI